MEEYAGVGERIKEVRKDLGITQQKFSERINIAKNYLCSIENNKRTVGEKTIEMIATEFNVRAEWLKYGTGDKYHSKSTEDRLASYVLRLLGDGSEDKMRLIEALRDLNDNQIHTLRVLVEDLARK